MANTIKDLDTELVYYLAFPYSPLPDYPTSLRDSCKKERYLYGESISVFLINKGFTLIEPIGMSHSKAETFPQYVQSGYEYWKARDRKLVERSDAVIVLNLFDWNRSVGVSDEIAHATKLGKPVYLLSMPSGLNFDSINSLESFITLLEKLEASKLFLKVETLHNVSS